MAHLQKYLPNELQLSLLAQLREPLIVRRCAQSVGGPSMLVLEGAGNPNLHLRVLDHTVSFKFELFELIIEPWKGKLELVEKARVADWDAIECLFRFEWLRPAMIGEVPPQYEKIVGERGTKEMIPLHATHLGVSMIGIAFSSNESAASTAIFSSDDDPVTLCISDNQANKQNKGLDCEVVNLNDVPLWIAELERAFL